LRPSVSSVGSGKLSAEEEEKGGKAKAADETQSVKKRNYRRRTKAMYVNTKEQ